MKNQSKKVTAVFAATFLSVSFAVAADNPVDFNRLQKAKKTDTLGDSEKLTVDSFLIYEQGDNDRIKTKVVIPDNKPKQLKILPQKYSNTDSNNLLPQNSAIENPNLSSSNLKNPASESIIVEKSKQSATVVDSIDLSNQINNQSNNFVPDKNRNLGLDDANKKHQVTRVDIDDTTFAPPAIEELNLDRPSQEIANLINHRVRNVAWQGMNYHLHSPKKVAQLYKALNFSPLWSHNGTVTPLAEQMINTINQAKYQALKPTTYHQNAVSAFKAGQSISEPDKFDILLTDAFVTYAQHLKRGILTPKSQFPTWNMKVQPVDFLSLYKLASVENNLNKVLVVDNPDYYVLQKAYKDLLDSDIMAKIPPKVPYLRRKKTGESVRLLRERLGLDSSIDLYDADLAMAVRDYQKKNGLFVDGVAGAKTIRHLNSHRKDGMDLEKLAINMERLRWISLPKHQNYIWVNIPAYQMAVKNDGQTLFSSRVIVGRTKRPTPIFRDKLEHVVLAPSWNVPSTIFKKDKLPRLRKNPNAFAGRLDVINTRTGKIVDPSTVDWSTGGAGYRLRQRPGARNALGRMKFLFPNRHAVYLHDTPSRYLFKRQKRAFSSGCVRVQKAEDLAVFLLNHHGYDRDRIKRESRRGREKWITLDKSLNYPVILSYHTIWVDENGEIHNNPDIYRYDKKTKRAYRDKLKTL